MTPKYSLMNKTAVVYEVKGNYGSLLEYKTLVDLKVIPCISSLSSKHEQLCEKYKSIFNGIGKLKDTEINIHIDSTIQPVIHPTGVFHSCQLGRGFT